MEGSSTIFCDGSKSKLSKVDYIGFNKDSNEFYYLVNESFKKVVLLTVGTNPIDHITKF